MKNLSKLSLAAAISSVITANVANAVDTIYGGYSDTSSVEGKQLDIVGKTTYSFIYGGQTTKGNANKNVVKALNADYVKTVVGGSSTTEGNANNNIVEITNSKASGGSIIGGSSNEFSADNNQVTLNKVDGSYLSISGGIGSKSANNNDVSIAIDSVDNTIVNIEEAYGGQSDNMANNNQLHIKDAVVDSGNFSYIMGGYANNVGATINTHYSDKNVTTTANNNTVVLDNITVKHKTSDVHIKGGYANSLDDGVANKNTVTINNSIIPRGSNTQSNNTLGSAYISGGEVYYKHSKNTAITANENTVNINNSTVGHVMGGRAFGPSDSIERRVYTGIINNIQTNNNTITINNSIVQGDVYGGQTYTPSFSEAYDVNKKVQAQSINNTINFYSGTVEGTIYGGKVTGGVKNLVVSDEITGNSLNIGRKVNNKNELKMNSLKAGNIANFEYINFYLPSDVKNGDTALELTTTGNTDLSKSTVSAYLENATDLTKDSKINLIKTAGTLNNPNATNTSGVKVDIAGLIEVEGNIDLTDDNKSLQLGFKPTATNGGNSSTTDNTTTAENASTGGNTTTSENISAGRNTAIGENNSTPAVIVPAIPAVVAAANAGSKSKLILESQLVGVSMLEQGGDLSIDTLSKGKANAGDSNLGVYPFANVGGFNKRVKTGSHIDVKGGNLNLGVGADNGNVNAAVFLEHGKGHWDSRLDNGASGSGKNYYTGGGAFAQYKTQLGFYAEGSLRGGKVKTKSNTGIYNKYDLSSSYFGAHAGVGQKVNAGNNELDFYGKYYYLHTGSDSFKLNGVDVNVDSVNSSRVKLGVKDTINFSENNALYVGAAYQYAFDGKSRGYVAAVGQTAEIASPKLKGSTGIGEIGYQHSNPNGFEFSIGAKGYAGKERGIAADAKFKYSFK